MTPINNNQMSEQDKTIIRNRKLDEIIEQAECYCADDESARRMRTFLKGELSALINRERAEAVKGFVDWVKKNEEDEQKAQCLREMSFISFDNRWINSLKEMIEEYLSSERFK